MAEKDPLIEMNLRAMEYIWSKVPKDIKNGEEFIVYTKEDIPVLYFSGMVDTERWKLEDWEKAFEDCLGEDGNYWVSHKRMLALGRFRYHRTVGEPFDPLKMRTGKYTIDRLWKVWERSIVPSCSMPKEFIKMTFDQIFRKKTAPTKIFEKQIKDYKEKGGELEMDPSSIPNPVFELSEGEETVTLDRDHLLNIKKLIDTYPSPRRKMELAVQQMKMDKLQQLSDMATQSQKSTFELGKDFRETTKKSLKDMLVKASESAGGRKPKDEVINLAEMQKKKRPPTKF